MECPYCRTENRDGTRYCSSCGNFIGTPAGPSQGGAGGNTGGIPRSLGPGARLQGGRYVVKKVLGQGGMGAALLATDIRLDSKLVVIKELISDNVDATKLQEDVRNFKREVATLAHIDHPLVPNVTDHFQEGPRYFMVQEYVEGENLEDRLERTQQPMNERDGLICTSEVLDILDYLAQQTPPVVHRDIKPANIIIGTRDKRAHLVDFGIARADVARNAQRKQTSALGTPGYAPPEQYQGNADPRSDLYALAATLHHMLTNRDPRNHSPFSYPPVRTQNPQITPETEQVLSRALINDINQRYQSAAAMKQDIDNVLRQRFGVSGNIDTYTLGTSANSGPMQPTNYQSGQSGSMPGLPNPSGPVNPTVKSNPPYSMTPVQPLSPSYPPPPPHMGGYATPPNMSGTVYPTPPNMGGSQPSYPLPPNNTGAPTAYPQSGMYTAGPVSGGGPQQRKRRALLPVLLIAVILLGLLAAGAYYLLPQLLHPTAASSGIGVTLVNNENIGVSDGTYAFDTTLGDGDFKQQAAQALKANSGDSNSAISLLNQAISKSSNDAEALIYKENLRVVNSGNPYVTVVVATMLTGRDSGAVTTGRDDLQGAYVAQKEFNDGSKLHGGTQVRVLIANAGSNAKGPSNVASNVKLVMQQIHQIAQSDKTFVGVMGWPYSGHTLDSINPELNFPLVSQTASSDALTNSSQYFFRAAPSNTEQAIAGAHYAEQTLHAKKAVIFYDPQNSYTQSLSQGFSQQFTKDGNQVVAEEKYTVGSPSTLPALLQDALSKQADMIYFAGYASDVSVLISNPLPGKFPVMGGDALYELGGYSSGASAIGVGHLYFTAFAYPDEWDILGYPNKPVFFNEYPADFDPSALHQGRPYGFTRADNDVILSYDAMVTLLTGCDMALSSGKQTITPVDVHQALHNLNGAHALQGVSGQISLGADGNPVNKAIVALHVDDAGNIHQDSVLGQFLKP